MDQISTISSSKTYNWRYVCKFIVKNIMWREFWYFKTDQEWKLKIFFTNFSIVLTWFWRVDIYICSSLMVKLCKRGPKLDHQIRLAVEHDKGIPEVRTRRGSPSKCERDKSSKENRIFGKYFYYTSMFVYISGENFDEFLFLLSLLSFFFLLLSYKILSDPDIKLSKLKCTSNKLK